MQNWGVRTPGFNSRFIHYVTLGPFLNLSVPEILQLENWDNETYAEDLTTVCNTLWMEGVIEMQSVPTTYLTCSSPITAS